MQSQSDFLNTEEAAQYMRVSRRTVERLVQDGRLKWYRLGGHKGRRYKRGDLDQALTPVEPGIGMWPWHGVRPLTTEGSRHLAALWGGGEQGAEPEEGGVLLLRVSAGVGGPIEVASSGSAEYSSGPSLAMTGRAGEGKAGGGMSLKTREIIRELRRVQAEARSRGERNERVDLLVAAADAEENPEEEEDEG